jgi:hypothetical protein
MAIKTRAKRKKSSPKRATKKAARRPSARKAKAPEKLHAKRRDLGQKIGGYVAKLKGPVRETVTALVALVEGAVPEARAEIKWGMPVFSHHGLLCYLRAQAGYVRFGFYDHAKAMDDPGGRLEGGGNGRHVKIATVGEIDHPRFASWVRAAARLNSAAS